MWSSRLFWKLFLPYGGLLLLAVALCMVLVARWQEKQLIEQTEKRLHDSALLLGNDLETQLMNAPDEALQQRLQSLGERTGTRFTVIGTDGLVLADSEKTSLQQVATMDNHLTRSEFTQAALSGTGISRRMSPTVGVPFFYYALAIQDEGKTLGYVRAAQPVASIQKEVGEIRGLLGTIGLAIGLSGLLITYWLTNRIMHPVQTLTHAAKEIAAGQYEQRIAIATGDDFGTLARSFEQMSSELELRERNLRKSFQQQTTVLGGMTEGVVAVDAESSILFANKAAGKILGFNPQQAEGNLLLRVVRSPDLHELVQKAMQENAPCRREIEWPGDPPLTLDVRATPLPGNPDSDGPTAGVVLVLNDMTDLKRLEGLRKQFVANVSHELKTPLSSIKAYTETLLDGALDDTKTARHFLTRIDEQSSRLHELILDMLTIARIESAAEEGASGAMLERTDVSLVQLTQQCLAIHEPRAKTEQVTLRNTLTKETPHACGDEEALLQILSNLVDNAIKYTPAGGSVTVSCHIAPPNEDNQPVVLEVTDTGPGIAAEHHDRLFERFYRVDKARSRELGGTGLGLSIVKHLAQSMGGSVSVESELGQGSTFRVELPRA